MCSWENGHRESQVTWWHGDDVAWREIHPWDTSLSSRGILSHLVNLIMFDILSSETTKAWRLSREPWSFTRETETWVTSSVGEGCNRFSLKSCDPINEYNFLMTQEVGACESQRYSGTQEASSVGRIILRMIWNFVSIVLLVNLTRWNSTWTTYKQIKIRLHTYGLMGTTITHSHAGAVYLLTIVDDYSRKLLVYPLARKVQTFKKFKEWKTLIET